MSRVVVARARIHPEGLVRVRVLSRLNRGPLPPSWSYYLVRMIEAERRRVDVLGVGVSITDFSRALQDVEAWVGGGEQHYICVTGVHGVMESQHDSELLEIHNHSGLTIPDGIPMVWCARWAGARDIELMRGTDFTLNLCAVAAQNGWRCFFYGGGPGVPERLADRLATRFPGLQVAGTYSPPFRALTPTEDTEVIERMNQSGADVVFVGLSTPKQERWMAAHRGPLKASVMVGVGAAFDVHSGEKREAPRWTRPMGLEWLYRLLYEPRRLWKRYLVNNPAFAIRIVRRQPFIRGEGPAGSGGVS